MCVESCLSVAGHGLDGHEIAPFVPPRTAARLVSAIVILASSRKDVQEGVRECDLVDVAHVWVLHEVAVDEEEYRQVDLFVRKQALFLEAEALDLGKVRRDL